MSASPRPFTPEEYRKVAKAGPDSIRASTETLANFLEAVASGQDLRAAVAICAAAIGTATDKIRKLPLEEQLALPNIVRQ